MPWRWEELSSHSLESRRTHTEQAIHAPTNGKKEPALPKNMSYERQISAHVKQQQKTFGICLQRLEESSWDGCLFNKASVKKAIVDFSI